MPFTSTDSIAIAAKLGENPSVWDWGAVGDGVTDDGPAFTRAINDLAQSGGGKLYVPGGYHYCIKTPIAFIGCNGIDLVGDGASTVLVRGADMPVGQAVIYIAGASTIRLRGLLIEGQVVSPTQLQYGSGTSNLLFNNDAMDSKLTGNSSIRIDGPSSSVIIEKITIQHTGGYAILANALPGTIFDIRILDVNLFWNRPHLFGTQSNDMNYGAWTGGILFEGDGRAGATQNCVHQCLVDGLRGYRVNGNLLWSHVEGDQGSHQNVKWTNIEGLDIGLDGIGVQGISGGIVSNFTLRRVGYVTVDDSSTSVPKYLVDPVNGNHNGTGLDTGGKVSGVTYCDGTITSVNGGYVDLDGFENGNIDGLILRHPSVGEDEYNEDQINLCLAGGQAGINLGDTAAIFNVTGFGLPQNIAVENCNIMGMTAGGIRLGGARNCIVKGNRITHPASETTYGPIILFNLTAGLRAQNNAVIGNFINWSPGATGYAITEWGGGGVPWAGEKNWVAGNVIFGNCLEFFKDSNTTSTIAVMLKSAVGAAGSGDPSSGLSYDGQALTVPGAVASPAIKISSGYVLSAEGFATISTSGAAVNVPNGTIFGKYLTAATGLYFAGQFSPPPNPGPTNAALYFDTGQNAIFFNCGNTGWQKITASAGGAVGGAGLVQISAGGGVFTSSTGLYFASGALIVDASHGGTGIISPLFNANGGGTSLEFQGSNFSVRGDGHIATNGYIDFGLTSQPPGASSHALVYLDRTLGWMGFIIGASSPSCYIAPTGVVAPLFNATGSVAFQTSSGSMNITSSGAGNFQSINLTNGIACNGVSSPFGAVGGAYIAIWLSGFNNYGTAIQAIGGTGIQGNFSQIFLSNQLLVGSGVNLQYAGSTMASQSWVASYVSGAGYTSNIYASNLNQNLRTFDNPTFNILTTSATVAAIFNATGTGVVVQSQSGTFTITSAGIGNFQTVNVQNGIVSAGGIEATGFNIHGGSAGFSSGAGPSTPVTYTQFIFVGGICTHAS